MKFNKMILVLIILATISNFSYGDTSYPTPWHYGSNDNNIPIRVDDNGNYIPNIHVNENMMLTDVYGTWAQEAITYCALQGYLEGMLSRGSSYHPYTWCYKTELAVMLGRKQGIDYTQYTEVVFSDVEMSDDDYRAIDRIKPYYVNWAGKEGILKGNSVGALEDDDPLTKEQAASVIDRFIEKYTNLYDELGSDNSLNFKDQDQISEWAKKSIERLSEISLIHGDENGFFNPRKEIKRSEICQIIFDLAQQEQGNMKIHFKQLPNFVVVPELIYE